MARRAHGFDGLGRVGKRRVIGAARHASRLTGLLRLVNARTMHFLRFSCLLRRAGLRSRKLALKPRAHAADQAPCGIDAAG